MDDFVFEHISLNSRERNFATAIKAKAKFYESANIEVYDTEAFGRCVYLDGSLQLCEKFEHLYHETIVHPGLWNVPKLEKVLIIGGGDGGTLREVLKWPNLKKVVMCEILPEIVEVAKKHLPFTKLQDSLLNPIVELVFEDGAKYIKRNKEYFDAIIVDCSDPKGNSEVLYSREFIEDCSARLSDNGSFAIQAMNAFIRPKFVRTLEYELRRQFGMVKYIYVPMPCYASGGIGFLFAGDKNNPRSILPSDLKYINPRTIEAGFAMCHDILYQCDVEKAFNRYCDIFFDWRKHLRAAELEYIQSCFQFENEMVLEDGQVKHLEIGVSVMEGNAQCEFLTVMCEENNKELLPILNELIKQRKASFAYGPKKIKGVRFCNMFKTVEFIEVLTLDEVKQVHPTLYERRPERCYDKVRVYSSYASSGRFCGFTAVFSDLSRRYYVNPLMKWEAEIIRTNHEGVRGKVNTYGKVLMDSFRRDEVNVYETIIKNRELYDISFAL